MKQKPPIFGLRFIIGEEAEISEFGLAEGKSWGTWSQLVI